MQNITSKNKLGFSLIELSIVILVIGILVIGITKGSRIIKEARIKSAQSLTTGSPVASMSNILMWLESTSEKSFASSEKVNTALGATGTISSWNDINPSTATPNNATQVVNANKPRYIDNDINGLPSINFDGSSDFLGFDGTILAGKSYTVIVVEKRLSSAGNDYFISGSQSGDNQGPHLGYRTNTTMTFAQFANDLDVAVSGFASPTPYMHIFIFNSGNGKTYYKNGVQLINSKTSGALTPLISYNGAQIAKFSNGGGAYYNGNIGEIIIFSRAIKNSERLNIENYLQAKWGIK
jgi:prepilin-type N-terminal cleavage/methylation domain-containing protein